MKRFVTAPAALAVALTVFAAEQSVHAQVLTRTQSGAASSSNASQSKLVRRDAQVSPASYGAPGGCCANSGGCDESCCDDAYCDSGCCCPDGCSCYDSAGGCGGCGSNWSWCDWCGCGDWGNWCNLGGGSCNSRPWFVTADYLYVRANFSDAPAYLVHDPANGSDTFHELNFQYQSSYRFGGGYKLPCCGEEVRFLFTRMSSSADTSTPGVGNTIAGPFETSPGPEGTLTAHGQVDTKSYDVEFAKTIPLGGCCNTSCGDACNSCSHPSCPAWDITWEGGFRFAQVDWDRTYVGTDTNPQLQQTRTANATMNFQGGGPRFGVEGRRYFGQRQWCSAYLKGDISLLLGHAEVIDRRVTSEVDNPPDTVETQTARFRNIIPVTEIETGLTAQLTRSASLTTGYLFSAWHDLGFRDQFAFATFLETNYDDANILGFDGFFARLEVDF